MAATLVQQNKEKRRERSKLRSQQSRRNLLAAYGEPAIWLTGGAMTICLAMILGLLGLILLNGLRTFWPSPVVCFRLRDGREVLGEVIRSEWYRPDPTFLEQLPEEQIAAYKEAVAANGGWVKRRLVRTGNYELTNEHFRWVSVPEIAPDGQSFPDWAMVVERTTWGRFYGFPAALIVKGTVQASTPPEIWQLLRELHPQVRKRWRTIRQLETRELGDINHALEDLRLRLRVIELREGKDSPAYRQFAQQTLSRESELQKAYDAIRQRIEELRRENANYVLRLRTADGQEKDLCLADIVRAYPANQLTMRERWALYGSRVWEFLSDEPREANSEGGIFPAIFGTAFLTLLMSLAVVPLGVIAALYLREYARGGVVVSIVRVAINNLAGVPSIVFGVFGLGFFCYVVGGTIDQLFFPARLPSPTFGTGGILWASLTLALLTLPVVIVATEEALAAVPHSMREGSYACGASRWQTIRRIVLPRAMPGVLTGTILAMARGAGEVAPLMLVGAVKMAPELPVSHRFPYIHLQRSFMHLGFHIYDLGFQSPNSEAAKPMVFSAALLLIVLVAMLNLGAMLLRSRLRKGMRSTHL
ncbi:MAG: phosphate ABC transporter permease PstA [Thermogutta sp.]